MPLLAPTTPPRPPPRPRHFRPPLRPDRLPPPSNTRPAIATCSIGEPGLPRCAVTLLPFSVRRADTQSRPSWPTSGLASRSARPSSISSPSGATLSVCDDRVRLPLLVALDTAHASCRLMEYIVVLLHTSINLPPFISYPAMSFFRCDYHGLPRLTHTCSSLLLRRPSR